MAVKASKLLLSYNICYQAMCHKPQGSAKPLGQSCDWIIRDKLTICAKNIADFIDGVPAASGYTNFDFVGLQETNKIKYLVAEAKHSLSKLKMIADNTHPKHGAKAMYMASFYNATKYTLVEHICSHFNTYKEDRPFHILILTDKTSKEHIIFINIHAPHRKEKNIKDPRHHYFSSFKAISYDLGEAIKTMKSFDNTINYKLILTGDFNECGWDDHGKKLSPMQWKPLDGAGISTDVEISNIIFSCSKKDGCWHKADGRKGGDYIFTSGTAATISVPKNYTFAPSGACHDKSIMKTIWQSDHLPVMAELS